jgi:hypothetical protein
MKVRGQTGTISIYDHVRSMISIRLGHSSRYWNTIFVEAFVELCSLILSPFDQSRAQRNHHQVDKGITKRVGATRCLPYIKIRVRFRVENKKVLCSRLWLNILGTKLVFQVMHASYNSQPDCDLISGRAVTSSWCLVGHVESMILARLQANRYITSFEEQIQQVIHVLQRNPIFLIIILFIVHRLYVVFQNQIHRLRFQGIDYSILTSKQRSKNSWRKPN